MKKMIKEYIEKDYKFDKVTMLGIIFLIVVFAGVFGWFYEFIFYYFNSGMKTFYWRGGNFLPWINIYAYGALLICFFTYRRRKKTITSIFDKFYSLWSIRIFLWIYSVWIIR